MTKKEYMIEKYDAYAKKYAERRMDFFIDPSIARIDPFKIADNVYYVGDKKVCIHLIDTGDGLILVDSGYLGAAHLLVDSIWRAGFDPRDIRIILHTHGHSDHFGASDAFKRIYGCKNAVSRVDAEYMRERYKDGTLGSKLYPLARLPEFDMEIEDGDVIELGNVKIKCILCPGHTEGVLSLFFDTTYEGKTYLVGLFGGVGTNALTLPYIYKNGYTEKLPYKMLDSIERLRKISVDIHLGNHPSNNHTLQKRERQLTEGGNPFIDPSSWGELLDSLEGTTKKIIEENDALSKEAEALGYN